jgi:hypothetical protein
VRWAHPDLARSAFLQKKSEGRPALAGVALPASAFQRALPVIRWEASGGNDLRIADLRITLTTFGTVHCHDPPPAMPASPGFWLCALEEEIPRWRGQAHVETFLGARRTIAPRSSNTARSVLRSRFPHARFTERSRIGEETTIRRANRGFAPLRGRAHPPCSSRPMPGCVDHTDGRPKVKIRARRTRVPGTGRTGSTFGMIAIADWCERAR